jgi:hypothetical protein
MLRSWIWVLGAVLLWAVPVGATDDPKLRREILKPLKAAERAGYERHQLKRYLTAFTKDAVWTHGRRAVKGPYDRVYTHAQQVDQLKRIWSVPATGRARLYFRQEALQLTDDNTTATYEVEIRHTFFGGNKEFGRRYVLKKQGKRWLIASVREWPREHQLGIEHTLFSDEFWLSCDESIEKSPATAPLSRMMQFMEAWRYTEALDVIRAACEGPNPTANLWIARATLAIEISQIDEARAAVKAARALDPLIEAPVKMRGEFPSAHHRP